MAIRLVTLSIHEALEEGIIKNRDSLPKIIGTSGKALVLSDNQDCYFTTTIHGCSCDESISGTFPCCHQTKAYSKEIERIERKKKIWELGKKFKDGVVVDVEHPRSTDMEEQQEGWREKAKLRKESLFRRWREEDAEAAKLRSKAAIQRKIEQDSLLLEQKRLDRQKIDERNSLLLEQKRLDRQKIDERNSW